MADEGPQWPTGHYDDFPNLLRKMHLEHDLPFAEPCDCDAKLFSRALGQNARRQNNNNTNQNQPPNRGNTSSPTAYSPSGLGPPNMPAAPASPSLTTTMTSNDQAHQNNQAPKKVPIFFREDYAGFIVKGNFMTLAARPHLVEEGEWLAHQGESRSHFNAYLYQPPISAMTPLYYLQRKFADPSRPVVEQNRLLSGMLRCMQEKDRSTGRPTCSEQSCPAMTAGP